MDFKYGTNKSSICCLPIEVVGLGSALDAVMSLQL